MVFVIYPTILSLQALTFSEYFLQACRFNLTSSVAVKWANIAVALLIICKLELLMKIYLIFSDNCNLEHVDEFLNFSSLYYHFDGGKNLSSLSRSSVCFYDR
jgi:hypothetical protein